MATRHVLGPSSLRGRAVRRRIRTLDRAFTRFFKQARDQIGATGSSGQSGSAGEWLLDNDFVVSEALETLRGALPSPFLRRLPGVRSPDQEPKARRPRIEVIAFDLVKRERGRIELDEIHLFLEGYQEVRSLNLAELWALPSFLRLALLEELLEEIDRGGDEGGEVGPYILSLRMLAGEDWRGMVESLSRVHEVLSEDPAGVFSVMDFRTRDRYRREVEEIAEKVDKPEEEVARQALELARRQAAEPREGHVGFYLVDQGRETLFRDLGGKVPFAGSPFRRSRLLGFAYFGGIGILTAIVLWVLWSVLGESGWSRVPLVLLGVIPALGVSVALANWVAAQVGGPRPLPRLDVRNGIPDRFRTLVAVPVLLGSREDVESLLWTLETNYQANPDPALTFALVSDFPDAGLERTPDDATVLAAATAGIRELNVRYSRDGNGPFMLLHRGRRWNAAEGCWMGWERKRGKLAELNQVLLGRPSGLWVAEGDATRLEGNPFVLTLDADTRMPRDAAARLVGTLAHPLNRPEVGRRGRIRRGYSVLQPRIEMLPDPSGGTAFSRIYGGVQGLDLYAHAAFDVYQDLFGVGIFAGKGIYDVHAFEASLSTRTPENSLLSHDLFEGAHGRAGLVSDLVLLEEFPGHPLAHARRSHRWIRGDWQILPWLFPLVPGEDNEPRSNRFSALSRWMIADNLRRSVQPIATVLLLLLGWIFVSDHMVGWTLTLAAIVGIPFLTGTVDAGRRALREFPRRADLEAEARALSRALGRWGIELSFLPFDAVNASDAIVRTLYRVFVSRRRLLEWTSAAATARTVRHSDSLGYLVRQMRSGPIVGVVAGGTLLLLHGALPFPVALLVLLWIVSPVVAFRLSRPRRRMPWTPRGEFSAARARVLARRIWGYYERFQGPERHWLAPDHFQEAPGGEVAERTSPTNLGMAMIGATTAWDLGFVGTSRLVAHTRNTMEGMRKLHRYRGHFLNWYDTSTLEPLHPRYVSTVDSGNLAAAFLITREALKEAAIRPIWTGDRADGIVDTVRVVVELLRAMPDDGGAQALLVEMEALESRTSHLLRSAWAGGIPAYVRALEVLRDHHLPMAEDHVVRIHDSEEATSSEEGWSAIQSWLSNLRSDVEEGLDEILLFLPWLSPRDRDRDRALALNRAFVPDGGLIPSLHRLEALLSRESESGRHTADLAAKEGESEGEGFQESLNRAADAARILLEDIDRMVAELDEWFGQMDFSFLYDRRRDLLRIGFSVSSGELDPNHYDLLASEARIASAVAIAKGEAPPTHWLHLGRPFTWTARGPVLLSWAGTMFEYLMPTLFLKLPPETVLEEACRRAVEVQHDFGKKHKIPWGISESGYHVLSPEGHYQYQAFGTPDLGLRRRPGNRLVVAPYASLMAVSFAPAAVERNLDVLTASGGMGPWGPYEALDFGLELEWRKDPRVVRSYMSHHHGMILGALGNYLTDHRLVDRFHRDPRIATVEPYLYERIPWRRAVGRKWVDRSVPDSVGRIGPGILSWSPDPDRLPPPSHHLSAGKLVVSMGSDGRGGSRWGDWSVVRGGVGRGIPAGGPDLTLMDLATGGSWRPLPDASAPRDTDQQVIFEPHRAEFIRETNGIRTRMEVFLPPEAGVEVRQVVLSSESERPRHLRLAVSTELALAPFSDDMRHPAFHKLFVRAEALPEGEGLLFERRPRSPDEAPPALLVSILNHEGPLPPLRWGTSREVFLGRRGSRLRPAALDRPELLTSPSNPHHPLDPMASVVIDVELEPWGELAFTFLLAVGPDRESVIRSASELRSPRRREWARIQARARVEGELLRLGVEADAPRVFEELLSHVLYPRRNATSTRGLHSNLDLRQSCLWQWGISGDIPFILLEGESGNGSRLLGEVLRAQRWWNRRGERVDVVVVSRGTGEYQDQVRDRIRGVLAETGSEGVLGRLGGVHVVRGDNVRDEDRSRLRALAVFRLDAGGRSLEAQLASMRPSRVPLPALIRTTPVASSGTKGTPAKTAVAPRPSLESLVAPSAFGGFDPDSGEYVVRLGPGEATPAPWVNIVAREGVGFLVTESGGSFTWVGDAGEFRLTPWNNDPIVGLEGEVLYLRDDESGEIWTPAPGPLGRRRPHDIRHGWGQTTLRASDRDVEEEVSWFLHPTLPVKVARLRLRNGGTTPRRMSATFFVDWVLGPHTARTAGRLDVVYDSESSAVLARNPFSLQFAQHIGFLATRQGLDGMATDREEFLGTAGPFDRVPVGLRRIAPGERGVPQGQPCGVLTRSLTLDPGQEVEVHFLLGAVEGRERLAEVLRELRSGDARTNLSPEESTRHWGRYLGRVRVRTPDPGLNELLNGWLTYQTVVSRLRGRTGFYQSGGAFGFRDQLQDVYALLPLDPRLAEQHLCEAAARQFRQGDVLHWWHPGTLRGVQTRCSDDLLWLPWVLAQTVRWTGDFTLLNRSVPYLEGPPLPDGVHERYDAFPASAENGTLWDHAMRAVERTANLLSPRGLPLMGTGDWNDGMDRVGMEGRGESIWLGWFFLDICRLLIPIARKIPDERAARRMEEWSLTVRDAVEAHGWDGEWYRRAFFDDGAPLGSRDSREARIDSLAQSWAVISQAADPDRARQGLDAAWEQLVRPDEGIALLLSPPFEGGGPDPGYIAAYPPGVRENGGQYTHAAAWLVRALAQAGEGDRAGRLLRLLLPTRHAEGEGTHRYRVEPYVMAADVYGVEPHVGRGGWTWYTGSAGWIWRVALEDILGIGREGNVLRVDPCIPSSWDGFEVDIQVEETRVAIRVANPDGVSNGVVQCTLDGVDVDPMEIPIRSVGGGEGQVGTDGEGSSPEGRRVQVELVLGKGSRRTSEVPSG